MNCQGCKDIEVIRVNVLISWKRELKFRQVLCLTQSHTAICTRHYCLVLLLTLTLDSVPETHKDLGSNNFPQHLAPVVHEFSNEVDYVLFKSQCHFLELVGVCLRICWKRNVQYKTRESQNFLQAGAPETFWRPSIVCSFCIAGLGRHVFIL